MRRYIRDKTLGGCYFLTFALQDRRSSLLTDNIESLRQAYRDTKKNHEFELNAMVVLPDHIHMLLTLPETSDNYAVIIASIKSQFSRQFKNNEAISLSRKNKRERGFWQRRFWEHRIRDDLDFENHMNYIHYNPVKHGYVSTLKDWEYSTFHRFVTTGIYDNDWGCDDGFESIQVQYDD